MYYMYTRKMWLLFFLLRDGIRLNDAYLTAHHAAFLYLLYQYQQGGEGGTMLNFLYPISRTDAEVMPSHDRGTYRRKQDLDFIRRFAEVSSNRDACSTEFP